MDNYGEIIVKKGIQIFLIIITLISCSRKEKHIMRSEKRVLYFYENNKLKYQRPYQLTIKFKDSFNVYHYKFKNDSTKNITYKYLKKSNKLVGGPFEFKLSEKDKYYNPNIIKVKFDLYKDSENNTDGNNPLLFNQEYGILNNGYSVNTYIFLKENDRKETTKGILSTLWN